jgi:indolepyruvate decarboxylase
LTWIDVASHGLGAVSTTYGVGELSAINAIAGAYAEHVPVFHLVGMPNMTAQAGHMLVHHTLGNGEFDFFRKMADPVVCASAIMTPQNVAYETERLIAEALYHRSRSICPFRRISLNRRWLAVHGL